MKPKLSPSDHEKIAARLVDLNEWSEELAKRLVEIYGLTDYAVDSCLQLHKTAARLQSELNRRFVSARFHEPDHKSPYYPNRVTKHHGYAGEVESGDEGLSGLADEHGPG